MKRKGFKRIKKVLDNCQICSGLEGGVLGNENIYFVSVMGTTIKYKVMVCDYCSLKHFS